MYIDSTELISSKFKEIDDLTLKNVSLEDHVRKLQNYTDDADIYEQREQLSLLDGKLWLSRTKIHKISSKLYNISTPVGIFRS